MALRERQKEQRRQRILDAAESLIRESGSTVFTMVELARRAETSPTTPYNLFGSKGTVLYSLLHNMLLDSLKEGGEAVASGADPVEHAVMIMASTADRLISDPNFFRPLLQYHLVEQDLKDRPRYMDGVLQYWRRSVDGLVRTGRLSDEAGDHGLSRDDVALALLTHSIGVSDLWVQGELRDGEFRARMIRDAAMLLFAVVDDEGRVKLRHIILSQAAAAPSVFSFPSSRGGRNRDITSFPR